MPSRGSSHPGQSWPRPVPPSDSSLIPGVRGQWARTAVRALTLIVVMVTAGCQLAVDVTVVIDDEHGRGTARVDAVLDAEAVEALDGIDGFRGQDLIEAGWTVADPAVADDGSVTLSASKGFDNAAQMVQVLAEITGPEGPYSRFALRTDRAFARTSYRFEGVLDGTAGVSGFADPALAEALDGLAFGVDLAALEADLGVPPGSLVTLRLRAALPGDDTGGGLANATYATEGERRLVVWETTLDAAEPVPVLLTSEITRFRSVGFVIAALACAALFVVILIVWAVVSLRRRRRRRQAARRAAAAPRPIAGHEGASNGPAPENVRVVDRPDAHGDAGPSSPPAADPEVGPEAAPALELVIIGGPGVAFGVRDQVDDVVAFARAHGSLLEYPRIADHHGEASLGRLSTAEMWMAIGAEGDPATLDEEFLGQYQPAPGLRDFVGRARARGYRVAYLGDGPSAWAEQMRRSFMFGDLIDPWVVSGAVGAPLPELSMFEALRRTSGVAPASCLLIDDRLRVLEAARTLGYGTAWFSPTGRATEAPGHSIIRGFVELLAG